MAAKEPSAKLLGRFRSELLDAGFTSDQAFALVDVLWRGACVTNPELVLDGDRGDG